MKRRSFLGALAAAVIAPFLPKIAKAEPKKKIALAVEGPGGRIDILVLDHWMKVGEGSLPRGRGITYTRMSDGSIEAEAFGRSIGFDQLNL